MKRVGVSHSQGGHELTESLVTMLAAEIGILFALASGLAWWAKRGFRLPKRNCRTH